jgi:hypothetical protein
LRQVKEKSIDKRWVAQQEKDDLQVNFVEDRARIQKEKEQLLPEKMGVKRSSQQSTSLCDRPSTYGIRNH